MKAEINPEYREVLFIDSATGEEWVCRSTMNSEDMKEVDGKTLPVVKLEISSASHPFGTGQMREVDTDGRVDRFRKRYGKKRG